MNSVTIDLLDDLAFHFSNDRRPISDGKLAQELGYSRQRISKWRNGDRLGRENLDRFIDILYEGDTAKKAEIVLRWFAETEKDADMIPVWKRLQQVATNTAAAVMVFTGLMGTPPVSDASDNLSQRNNIYYVK